MSSLGGGGSVAVSDMRSSCQENGTGVQRRPVAAIVTPRSRATRAPATKTRSAPAPTGAALPTSPPNSSNRALRLVQPLQWPACWSGSSPMTRGANNVSRSIRNERARGQLGAHTIQDGEAVSIDVAPVVNRHCVSQPMPVPDASRPKPEAEDDQAVRRRGKARRSFRFP